MLSIQNFVFLFLLGGVLVESHAKVVICYYGTWATYRPGNGKFDVSNVNTELCTHLVYTFAGINTEGKVISLDPYLDLPDNSGRNNFGKFNALKKQNPKLKTILAVGGWNEGSAKYSNMSASPALRKNFITSAKDMVLEYEFDGLDVDWEYPNQRDSTHGEADIENYSTLLKELRQEFDKHGLIISIAVAAVKNSALQSYDIPTVCQYVDFVNIMAYDLYGPFDKVTGHNAALHKGEGDENTPKEKINSVDVILDFWLGQDCPVSKMNLGVPFYGRTFNLTNPKINGVRAPSSGVGIAGPFTATKGNIGYNEFCVKLQTEKWDARYDALAEVPYAVQGRNWVSYDDPNSITKKVEYAMNRGLGGIMVWSIETDDFHGLCGEDFALLRVINKVLDSDIPTEGPVSTTTVSTTSPSVTSDTTTTSPTTTTTPSVTSDTTTTSSPTTGYTTPVTTTTVATTVTTESTPSPSSSVCKQEGLTANPDSCTSFFMCVRDPYHGRLEPVLFQCPDTLYWDDNEKICNYKDLVKCNYWLI